MADRSPAQVYAVLFGAVLTVAGIIGFFYSADFGSPGKIDDVFGILTVNGWHNIVHIATGVAGLLAFRAGYAASRSYAIVLGVVYIVVAIWGFIIGSGDAILSIVPINTADNFLHVLIGIAGVAAFVATPPLAESRQRPATA